MTPKQARKVNNTYINADLEISFKSAIDNNEKVEMSPHTTDVYITRIRKKKSKMNGATKWSYYEEKRKTD